MATCPLKIPEYGPPIPGKIKYKMLPCCTKPSRTGIGQWAAYFICFNNKGRSKRSVLKQKTIAKNKNEDEILIGRFTPSDWSNREKEAQETVWARFRF